jgi:hypothetical protein
MPKEKRKILFIIKQRYTYGQKTKAYGLYNSCDFVTRKLNELGIEAKVVQVVDNNSIDKEVSLYKPTDCFIEALWVVPEKFLILAKLHPDVNWHIRLHSKSEFIAVEGNAFNWMNEYINLRNNGIKIFLSANNYEFYKNLNVIYPNFNISYTPNLYYPSDEYPASDIPDLRTIENEFHIGIFGALRPLKNHLQQAIWAIEYGKLIKRPVAIHINVSEHESYASSNGVSNVLNNLRNLFKLQTSARLVEHPWYSHSDFLYIVKQMDLGMQVSFSETYNITAADFIHMDVPIIGSNEIKFINGLSTMDSNSSDEAISVIKRTMLLSKVGLGKFNKFLLNRSNNQAIKVWKELFQ